MPTTLSPLAKKIFENLVEQPELKLDLVDYIMRNLPPDGASSVRRRMRAWKGHAFPTRRGIETALSQLELRRSDQDSAWELAKCGANARRSTISFLTESEIYIKICVIIDTVSKSSEQKRLLFCRAHGVGSPRRTRPPEDLPTYIQEFRKRVLASCLSGEWCVRIVDRVSDSQRLAMVLAELEQLKNAPDFALRAAYALDALPLISPLIIGECNAFLGLDHNTFNSVQGGFHLHGKTLVTNLLTYWNQLWEKCPHWLREPGGLDPNAVAALRDKISQAECRASSIRGAPEIETIGINASAFQDKVQC